MSSSSGIRVLYMEDDAGLARLVQKRLSRSGFNVTIASDGQSGLDLYKQNMFDIVAVDQEMPGLKGVDVIRAMSAEKPIPPIIMITGQGDEMLAVEAMKIGADEYIIKDSAGKYIDALKDIIKRLLEHHTLVRAKEDAIKALQESEEKYRRLFDLSSDAIVLLNTETLQLMDANLSAENLYAYPYNELVQMKATDLSAEPEQTKEKLKNNATKVSLRHHRKKDGTVFPVEITANYFDFHNISTTICCIRDISDRIAAEKEKETLESQLRQAQKMESVGRLAGGVAHDYNNALTSIMGFTELVMKQVSPQGPVQDDLKEIYAAATRAADITRQLLAFARKQTISPQLINLNAVVNSLLKMMRRLIGEDISLNWLPEEDVWPVHIDKSQLDQVMANLCVNSRDAIDGVGKITIETANTYLDEVYCREHAGFYTGEYAVVAVSDNGCGIEKNQMDNIFEPFYTTKELNKGTGLGLAMVYGIVKQNNGFIHVYSEIGEGTTVKIYLPRKKGDPKKLLKDTMISTSPMGKGETILLVEDDKQLLKLARKVLENLNYLVLVADQPTKALVLAEHYPGTVNLLLTDVVMPDMNGRELSESIVKICPDIKTVFMSGYTENAVAHHGVLDDGVNFINKPFSKNDIAVLIRKVLDETE